MKPGETDSRAPSAHGPALAAWALVLNALVWGLSWIAFRALEQMGVHPLWSTAFIYLLALVWLLLRSPSSLRFFSQHPQLWLLLLATGLSNVGFNWAVTVGDVVRVVLLFYLMPAWSVLLAWLLLNERPHAPALLRLALALAGVVIVLKTPESPWPLPSDLMDWLALLSGLTFALTNVLLLRLKAAPDEARMLAMFGGGALLSLAAALAGLPSGLVQAPPALAAPWLLGIVLTSAVFVAANMGLQYGAARLPASTTALVLLTEVVFASVSSLLLGATELQPRTLLGGGLIVLAAMWSALAPAPSDAQS